MGLAPFSAGGQPPFLRVVFSMPSVCRPEMEREEWSAWNTGSDRIGLVPVHPPLWFWFLAL